jgi:hypothetical protein
MYYYHRPPQPRSLHTMYITTELFGPDPPSTSTASHTSQHMAETQATAGLGKRKRRLDAEEGISTAYEGTPKSLLSARSNTTGYSSHTASQRASPESSRTYRIFQTQNHGASDPTSWALTYTMTDSRPIKQAKRTAHSSRRITLAKQSSHIMDIDADAPLEMNTHPAVEHSTSDLRPCHICHKAPKRRKDLENYLQCQNCDNRACYVCARSCSGRCGKQLCSKCCVEVGEDGNTWCLGCYQRNVNT